MSTSFFARRRFVLTNVRFRIRWRPSLPGRPFGSRRPIGSVLVSDAGLCCVSISAARDPEKSVGHFPLGALPSSGRFAFLRVNRRKARKNRKTTKMLRFAFFASNIRRTADSAFRARSFPAAPISRERSFHEFGKFNPIGQCEISMIRATRPVFTEAP